MEAMQQAPDGAHDPEDPHPLSAVAGRPLSCPNHEGKVGPSRPSEARTWGVGFQVCLVQALRSHVCGPEVRVAEQLHAVRAVREPGHLPRLHAQLQRGRPHPAVQALRQVPCRFRAPSSASFPLKCSRAQWENRFLSS